MSDRDLLLQIAERLVRQETKLDDLLGDLKGVNGQAGIISEFRSIKTSHEACLKRQLEEKEAAILERKIQERRFLTAATIGCGIVGALTPYILRFIIFALSFFAPERAAAAEIALLDNGGYSIFEENKTVEYIKETNK